MSCIGDISQKFILNNRWLFDVRNDQVVDIVGNTGAVQLKPVEVRVLTILVASPRIVLTRQRLLDDGWASHGFEVCENRLNQVICNLRSTFQRLDATRAYIKTIPRIGYCLVVDAHPALDHDETSSIN